jgi:hypothetical protein
MRADSAETTLPASTALWISIAGAVGTIVGATLSPVINYFVNERQMDVKMVEIGISILRAPPKEDIALIRSWAIDVIEKSSGRRFTDAQRGALLKQELPWNYAFSSGFGSDQPSANKPVTDRFPLTPKN